MDGQRIEHMEEKCFYCDKSAVCAPKSFGGSSLCREHIEWNYDNTQRLYIEASIELNNLVQKDRLGRLLDAIHQATRR